MLASIEASSTSSGGNPTSGDAVRVLVAADNEVLRVGVATLIKLHQGFAVSEAPAGMVTLVKEAQARRPDVFLVDIAIGERLRELLDARNHGLISDVAVVALAADDLADPDVLRGLVQWGINGIVTINDQAAQLCGAVRAVHRGARWISPTIGGRLLECLTRPQSGCPATTSNPHHPSLTRQERRVLALVADGLTVGQIATRIHRSESAVKYHLSNMSAKYQASNRAHLVYLAVRTGELPIDCLNSQRRNGLNDSGQSYVDLVT